MIVRVVPYLPVEDVPSTDDLIPNFKEGGITKGKWIHAIRMGNMLFVSQEMYDELKKTAKVADLKTFPNFEL